MNTRDCFVACGTAPRNDRLSSNSSFLNLYKCWGDFVGKSVDVTTNNHYNIYMSYEWDEQKRQINIKKHGLDFVDVTALFDGEIVTLPDERFDYGETRLIVMGILRNQIVVVVYTERGENIRIISARKATKNEQIYYFQEISN